MKKQELYSTIQEKFNILSRELEGNNLQSIIENTLDLHALVHPSAVSNLKDKTIFDYVLDYMRIDNNKAVLVPRMCYDVDLNRAGADKVPLCWQFWHLYRIEDLVTNILIANQNQIFNDEWEKKINSPITDTGNALEPDELVEFANRIQVEPLIEYILTVSKNTREIISNLTLDMLNQKATKEQLDHIVECCGITQDKRSIWLNDFWGSLTVSGMILTPLTSHHMMHLPASVDYLSILE